jgi:hypothetical protein
LRYRENSIIFAAKILRVKVVENPNFEDLGSLYFLLSRNNNQILTNHIISQKNGTSNIPH